MRSALQRLEVALVGLVLLLSGGIVTALMLLRPAVPAYTQTTPVPVRDVELRTTRVPPQPATAVAIVASPTVAATVAVPTPVATPAVPAIRTISASTGLRRVLAWARSLSEVQDILLGGTVCGLLVVVI